MEKKEELKDTNEKYSNRYFNTTIELCKDRNLHRLKDKILP